MPEQAVNDILDLKLQLRRDLTITPDVTGKGCSYLVEDRLHGSYFRLGPVEYALIAFLDGNHTVRQAWKSVRRQEGHHTFGEAAAASLARWLIQNDLANSPETSSAQRLGSVARMKQKVQIQQSCNPFFIRLPLICPDRLFAFLEPRVRWAFSLPVFLLFVGLAIFAASRVTVDWDRFAESLHGIFNPGRSLELLGCWLLLKAFHELGHGIVCRRYGGFVRSAGVIFILLAPLAFIDVTSSWRFRSKWPRIFTAAAGMYVEFCIASVAAIAWSYSSGIWAQLFANCVIMATASTVLFNGNPLMRFDGYYILSDLLEIPNLYGKGSQFLRAFTRRLLWGERTPMPSTSFRTSVVVRCYALASWFWRMSVVLGLIVAAAHLFHGAGIVLSTFGLLSWFALPTIRTIAHFFRGDGVQSPKRLRFVVVGSAAVVVAALLLSFVPWPFIPTAPGIVEFAPLTIVRAGAPGFVRVIHVHDGQQVQKGDLLLELENLPLQTELQKTRARVEKSRVLCRSYRRQQEMAPLNSEMSRLEALETELREISQRVEHLSVFAPTDGVVRKRHLHSLLGTYLAEGDEFGALGASDAKEIRISLAQEDAEHLSPGQAVLCRFAGTGRLHNRIEKIAPRASSTPLHPSLCATNGGPLSVQVSHDREKERQSDSLELIVPRIDATAQLSSEQSRRLKAGQRCSVHLQGNQTSIGAHLVNLLRQTTESLLNWKTA